MKKIVFISLFLQLLLSLHAQSQKCLVTDQKSRTFDISDLNTHGDWHIQDPATTSGSLFALQYAFNLCGPVQSTCSGRAIYEILEVMGTLTETCDNFGKQEKQTVSSAFTPEGGEILRLTWPDGDTCLASENQAQNGQPKQTTFEIVCDNNIKEDTFTYVHIDGVNITRCTPTFRIKHPVACSYIGGGFLSFLGNLIFWLFIGAALYLGIGIGYNMLNNGKKGIEAIPHLEFWKEVPAKAQMTTERGTAVAKEFYQQFRKQFNDMYANALPKSQPYSQV